MFPGEVAMTTMNAKRWMMAAMAAVLVMSLSACSDAGVTAPADDNEMIALSAVTIPDPDMSQPDVVMGGTLEKEFAMEHPEGRGRRHPFGRLLRALELNEEQLAAAKDCIAALEACMKEGMEGIRAQQKEILAGFRAERNAIIEQYKAGELTREQAAAALKELQGRVREAMAPLHEQAKVVMERCKSAFHDCLLALPGLTEDQIALLNRWIASEGGPGRGGDDHGGRGTGGGRP
jgi:hypothetical protein